jgi:phycoerythrobilin:ferredoxin oxidoreductase
MQPLFREDAVYQAKYTHPILPLFESHQQHLPWEATFLGKLGPFSHLRFSGHALRKLKL